MQKYNSPTDMGLNAVASAIIDDKKIRLASIKEIKSRLVKFKSQKNKLAVKRIEKVLKKLKAF